MKELEKWKKINSAQTVEDLQEAIFNIAEKGIIKGIRQQMMYLLHYKDK